MTIYSLLQGKSLICCVNCYRLMMNILSLHPLLLNFNPYLYAVSSSSTDVGQQRPKEISLYKNYYIVYNSREVLI